METEKKEYKKSLSEIKEAMISIVSVLNKHGKGELIFGLDHSGRVHKQDINEKTLRDISQAIANNIEPKIYPKIEKQGSIVRIGFSGRETPYFAYGRAYIRVSDEDRQMSAKELENFILNKNKDKLRWDNQACEDAVLEDIDEETVNKFKNYVKQSQRLPFLNEDKYELLNKLGLIIQKKLTNAAVLLFGKDTQKYFYNSTIRCASFKNELKEEFIDMKDIQGNLFECLEKTILFIKTHIKLSAKIQGLYRKEKWEIPIEALREAVINALIHRNYFDQSFTYIKIYDDSIVISNPGELDKSLKIEDLFKEHESKQRNPLLAKIFYFCGFIDSWGRGINN
ncbi:MAG TPA: ATP-dependent DNA helicase, partial [Candidatus Woesearchaeota archaeon]|nr:ATP-dependent DNA helicase [Candidatus Woesearchaeota archaeon]